MVAYVKTETTTENVATEIYKTKESEALTTKPKEAELLTYQQPTPRQIREREATKNATKLLTFNYNNMKTILDKINKADEIQAKKVELGTHEVELGLVQDILVEYKKGIDVFQQARDFEDKVRTTYKQSLSFFNTAESIINKIETNSRELGVEIPKDTLTLFTKIRMYKKDAETKSK